MARSAVWGAVWIAVGAEAWVGPASSYLEACPYRDRCGRPVPIETDVFTKPVPIETDFLMLPVPAEPDGRPALI